MISCSTNKEPKEFTQVEIEQLNTFYGDLTKSLFDLKYDLIKSSWSDLEFKKRLYRTIDSNSSIYNHIYDSQIKNQILMTNVELVNGQKNDSGKLMPSGINVFKNYGEITYVLFNGDESIMVRYRVELINNKPVLNDVYHFAEEMWLTERIKVIAAQMH